MTRPTKVLALLLGLAASLASIAPAVRADNAMFTFGEMLELQRLPLEAKERPLTDDEIILYQNMEFYIFTVFEALHAANNAAASMHQDPLFCAPAGLFRFEAEGEIASVAARITQAFLTLIKKRGASHARYEAKPASEVLLLGLRTAFPCGQDTRTLSAMRLDSE